MTNEKSILLALIYILVITPITALSETIRFVEGEHKQIKLQVAEGSSIDIASDQELPEWLKFMFVGEVTTIAGDGTFGLKDGVGQEAQFGNPLGIDIDENGNLFVADTGNHRIRRITPDGTVSTVAGNTLGYADGSGSAALFAIPSGVVIDANNNIFVTDSSNQRIRKVTPEGEVSTFAGDGSYGSIDGIGTNAQFANPHGLDIDSDDNLVVVDFGTSMIRKIAPSGEVSTVAGTGYGFADGDGNSVARFSSPVDAAVGAGGDLYISDSYNSRIRKITPDGFVSTFAGSGTFGLLDGDVSTAQFSFPEGIEVDADGNVFVLDDSLIRRISPEGVVSTYVGLNDGVMFSSSGYVDGIGAEARVDAPRGITSDTFGSLYVTEFKGRIRKVSRAYVLSGNPAASDNGSFEIIIETNDGINVATKTLTVSVISAELNIIIDAAGSTTLVSIADLEATGIANVNSELESEYQEEIMNASAEQVDTLNELQALVNSVNAINKIKTAAAENNANSITIADLNAIEGVSGVLEANLSKYQNRIAAQAPTGVDTASEIQSIIHNVNLQESLGSARNNGGGVCFLILLLSSFALVVRRKFSFSLAQSI